MKETDLVDFLDGKDVLESTRKINPDLPIDAMYAYLRSQEDQSEEHKSVTGVLLYPDAGRSLSEEVVIQGHRFRWVTVDLAAAWPQVDEQLLAIPAG